jgi:hypothetical protein
VKSRTAENILCLFVARLSETNETRIPTITARREAAASGNRAYGERQWQHSCDGSERRHHNRPQAAARMDHGFFSGNALSIVFLTLKERIVREVGYGRSFEGASAADLVTSTQARS